MGLGLSYGWCLPGSKVGMGEARIWRVTKKQRNWKESEYERQNVVKRRPLNSGRVRGKVRRTVAWIYMSPVA